MADHETTEHNQTYDTFIMEKGWKTLSNIKPMMKKIQKCSSILFFLEGESGVKDRFLPNNQPVLKNDNVEYGRWCR